MSKGCLYHIVRLKYLDSESPPIELVPVVRKFQEVFSKDLLENPLELEMEFFVDLLHDTNHISISPYPMDPAEFKELNAKLKDLLDKGFNRPSISPWGAYFLFLKQKYGFIRICIDYDNTIK